MLSYAPISRSPIAAQCHWHRYWILTLQGGGIAWTRTAGRTARSLDVTNHVALRPGRATYWRAAALALLAACAAIALPAESQPTAVVPPLALPGPSPVACSNVSQDFSRLAAGEDVQTYSESAPRADGSMRYVTSLLSDAANTLAVQVAVPSDGDIYGSFAGNSVPVVLAGLLPDDAPATRAPTTYFRPASTCRACSAAPRRRSLRTRRRAIPCFFSRTAISAARYPTTTSTRSRSWRATATS